MLGSTSAGMIQAATIGRDFLRHPNGLVWDHEPFRQ
jgi:hypothetical protein